jgi:outer membrane protein assembly factor BamB
MRHSGVVLQIVIALASTIFVLSSNPGVLSISYCGWMMPNGNPANTASVESSCSPSKHRIKKIWEVIPQKPIQDLLEGNGKVYYTTFDSLTCLASTNGKQLWQVPINNPVLCGIGTDKVCIMSDNFMMGFDASSGKKRWQKAGKLLSVVKNQIFYYETDSPGTLSCGSATDAALFWQYKSSKTPYFCKIEKIAISDNRCVIITKDWTDPAIDDKTLVYEANLHVIDVDTGKLVWRKSIGVDNFGYLAVCNNRITCHLKDLGLSVLDLATGQTVWFYPLAVDLSNGTISIDQARTIIQQDQTICLNSSTGKKLWESDLKRELSSQPVLSGDRIWSSVSCSGLVVCQQARDGKIVWKWGLKSNEKSIMAIGDGKIFSVWSQANSLNAFVEANDKLVYTIDSDTYTIDGQPVTTKAIPYVKYGHAFVSISQVMGSLGGFFSYDYKTKDLVVQFNDSNVVLGIGKNEITVNGTKKTIDPNKSVTPVISRGYIMIPADMIPEIFGIKSYINIKKKMVAFNASSL